MLGNEKGFSAPLLLLIVLALLAVPAYYWLNTNKLNLVASNNVQGASTTGSRNSKSGLGITVASKGSTWDFVEYLCESLEDCTASLDSGKRVSTISGGQTDMHDIVLEYSDDWDKYKYVKYFVRPGWYSDGGTYIVKDLGNHSGAFVEELADGEITAHAVIAPIDAVQNSFYESATFSDF